MNISIILFINNKDITIKQIKLFILNNIDATYYLILNNDTFEYIFSSFGNVYIENNYTYKSNCYQDVYNQIKLNQIDYVIEINPDFIIDNLYIDDVISTNIDITFCKSYVSFVDNKLKVHQSNQNNIVFCRCFSSVYLSKIEYNVFNFNRNVDIFELSQVTCILNTKNIKCILSQHIYVLYDNNIKSYSSSLISHNTLNNINNILAIDTNLNIDNIFNKYNIKNVQVSNTIKNLKEKIKSNYNLIDYNNIHNHKMFFGMYDDHDINSLKDYEKNKYILWSGSDIKQSIDNVKTIDCSHFVIDKSSQQQLLDNGFNPMMIKLSLVNKTLYSNISINTTNSKRIYIYDEKNNINLCDEIKQRLSNKYEFIYHSDINYNEKEMIEFYKTCFMGIYLNENYNTIIEEMGLLGLPVLTNNILPNAVSWINNVDYICEKIDYIHNNFQDKSTYISNSVLKYLHDDDRDEICFFIPIWYRHDTLKRNIDLLLKQEYYRIKIVIIYSNDSDKNFCKQYSQNNIFPIYVENKPLSKKFQFGAEFTKIFYPLAITINGSDDLLSLNFGTNIVNIFENSDANYIGCNFWYVYDVKDSTQYKFTYNDLNRVVGCGRSFKYTLLNDLNWQIFPLNLNSGIDTASNKMISNKKNSYINLNNDYYTLSIKEETDMITSMTDLLESNQSKWSIMEDKCELLKIENIF